jgi:hypothetical protein
VKTQRQETWIGEEEYLEREFASAVRHEYGDGRLHAVSGAGRNHERIVGNHYARLGHPRNSQYEAFASHVKIEGGTRLFDPDPRMASDDSEGRSARQTATSGSATRT